MECWGCYKDWRELHPESDLLDVVIYGMRYFVCPDCLDELPKDSRKEQNEKKEIECLEIQIS
jgi:hypothetical protein